MLFFRHVAISYQIMLLVFLSKTNVSFCIHDTIGLTCFNNFRKTDSEKKNEEIHDRDTKYYIEDIYHQFPDLYVSSNSR